MKKIIDGDDFIEYKNAARLIISRILKKDKENVTFFDIITIAMSAVEYIQGKKKLSGNEKKNLVKSILPLIVDLLVELGKIDSRQGENLKESLNEKIEMVEQFIDTAALITNDPDLINAGKWALKIGQEVTSNCLTTGSKCIIL